ncbi:MAG: hypothetical protein JO273_01140 [Methylobacteriaceae bacterium]|nr:hypothetical protein [Methylobacteriaceae bacterium]
MDEVTPDHLRNDQPSLASAMRRARIEEAERSNALAEVRGAELARLEMLHDAIRPVLAQVPEHIDLFDTGIVPGDRARLFIDMIGFIEMGGDRRTYRFLQDTRHGRVMVAESDRLDTMADAVAAYVARRLVEREKALAADTTVEDAARRYLAEAAEHAESVPQAPFAEAAGTGRSQPAQSGATGALSGAGRLLIAVTVHAIEYLGVVALLTLLIAGGFVGYHVIRSWLAARYGFPPE